MYRAKGRTQVRDILTLRFHTHDLIAVTFVSRKASRSSDTCWGIIYTHIQREVRQQADLLRYTDI